MVHVHVHSCTYEALQSVKLISFYRLFTGYGVTRIGNITPLFVKLVNNKKKSLFNFSRQLFKFQIP